MMSDVMHKGADQRELDKEEMMCSPFTGALVDFFISRYRVQPKCGASLRHSTLVCAIGSSAK